MKEIFKRLGPYQTIIVSSAILVASLLSVFFIVIPVIRKTWSQFQTFGSLRIETSALEAKAAFLESLDPTTESLNVALLTGALPSDKSLASLFTVIEQLAISSGLQIADITISEVGAVTGQNQTKVTPEERKLGSNIIPFVMTADGSLAQVQTFLEDAATTLRLVRVRSMIATFKSETLVTARIEMDAFYASLPTALGSVTQKLAPLSDKETELLARLTSFTSLNGEEAVTAVAPSEGGVVKANPFAP